MKNNAIQQIENYVKNVGGYEAAHDFNHVDRVRNWALHIAKKEGLHDLIVVEASALLHDIGLPSAERRIHGEIGSQMAKKFLKENNLFSEEKINEICNAIKYHNKNREGKGMLLSILRDADMMDLFGAMGIMRACIFASARPACNYINPKGETWGMTARDFDLRFDKGIGTGDCIVDVINFGISCYGNLNTQTARQLAMPYVKFMQNFVEQLNSEISENRRKA